MCEAIGANAASAGKPWNADALADAQRVDTGTERIDAPDDFVAGNDGQLGFRQLAVDHMQVGAADAACAHRDADLSGSGQAIRQLRPFQGGARFSQQHRVHGVLPDVSVAGPAGGKLGYYFAFRARSSFG